MSATTYPVHVDAELDRDLSRWLWLVKWLLVLPHYVVLVLLWLAFALLSVVAFFGILVTGRYPRSVFDFNVGVLRWSWRVAYYAYGALGTDRYPPFTLHDVPDYPAHLEVDYPAHLSRGLVLVKWWLLAIPHYLVVALLLGGAGYAVRAGHDEPTVWGAGLIGLLVLVAGVTLLVTGRYPRGLFDLVLGLNRWVLRVAGYAGLMTDRYPPFSLDQGGHEQLDPGTGSPTDPEASPPATGPVPDAQDVGPPPRSGWTAGRVVSLTLGALLVTTSLGLGLPASALVAADLAGRDDNGFVMSGTQPLATGTHAIVSGNLELHQDPPSDGAPAALVGDTRVTVEATDGRATFVGIAPTAQVEDYLDGVEVAVLTDVRDDRAVLTEQGTTAPPVPPGAVDIWAEQSSGTGPQTVTWTPVSGDWTVVAMNADGSAAVAVDAAAGAEVPGLHWVIAALLTLAGLALLVGVVLVAVPLRSVSRDHPARSS